MTAHIIIFFLIIHSSIILEIKSHIYAKATKRRHHEIVYTLIIIPGRSYGLRIERRLAPYHPQIMSDERQRQCRFFPKPLPRHCIAHGQFLKTEIGSIIGIILRQSTLRTYLLIPFLSRNHLSIIHKHATGISGICRYLRYTIKIKIGLGRGITDTTYASAEEQSQMQSFPTEVIAPGQIILRENRSKKQFLAIVGEADFSIVVKFNITIVIPLQIRCCVKVP